MTDIADVEPRLTEQPEPIDQPRPTELYGCDVEYVNGDQVVHVPRDRYLEVITSLRDDGFNMCADVTSVDYLEVPQQRLLPQGIDPERFEVVVNLLSFTRKRRIRLRTQVSGDDAMVPSLFDLYPGTEAMEREVFDLMGIGFDNHPDLTRILMPEDWEGHPLRKNYSQGRIPVQFKYPNSGYETSRDGEQS